MGPGVLRRVGVLGDVHAEDVRLAVALAYLSGLGLDRILAVGDIVDGAGDSGLCCRLLADAGVEAVRGNHDRWALKGELRSLPGAAAALDDSQRAYLAALPATRAYDTPAGRLLLCHGLGDDDMGRVLPDDSGYALSANNVLQDLLISGEYRFVINGHTHRPMARDFGGLTVINAGTIHRAYEPGFVTVDFVAKRAQFYRFHEDESITAGAAFGL